MPSAQRVPAVPVRLTERLLVAGLTIKDDLTKAFAAWETNFRDPVKQAMLDMPVTAEGEVTQLTVGGVKVFLAKTFPKSSWDLPRLGTALDRAITGGAIQLQDLHTLLAAGAISIANPEEVARLLSSRAHVNASSFVIQPENPTVPTRVDLKWGAVPGSQPLVGPLADLPDRVALAAAGTNGGDRTVHRPASALARAEEIDRANAQSLGVAPIQPTPVAPAAAGTVAVRRDPPMQAVRIADIPVEIEDPAPRRPRRRTRRTR